MKTDSHVIENETKQGEERGMPHEIEYELILLWDAGGSIRTTLPLWILQVFSRVAVRIFNKAVVC
jgi:hypothetical protein